MKKRRFDVKQVQRLINVIKIVFFVLIGLVIVLGIINHISLAAGPGEAADTAKALKDWVSELFTASEYLVSVVAVVMIIIAGIVYALDLGGGKQIGLAKDMIISTISGVILFMLASWLLAEIGGPEGLFPPVPLENLTSPSVPSGVGGSWDSSGHYLLNDQLNEQQQSNIWDAFGPDKFK